MKYDQIVPQVNDILRSYTIRLTLRQIFYRLVSQLRCPNTVNAYKQLSRMLVKARERGEVDDSRIEDRSRSELGLGDYGYDNFEDFVDAQIERFKDSWEYWTRKVWETQERRIIIALEKDALSRLFTDISDKFRVKVFPTRGYGSYTFVKKIAEETVTDKPTTILYFGDYDPSGRDIERDLGDRGEKYGGRFSLERIALSEEQIKEYNLPPRPEDAETLAKLARDSRTKRYGLEYAVELDALEPTVLQELIQKAIQANIDTEAWNEMLQQIKEERDELKAKFEKARITFDGE